MAIINSYPTITPKAGDLVILTDTSTTPHCTKTATVSSINAISTAPDIITVKKTFTSTEIQTIADGAGAVSLSLVDAPGAFKVIAPISVVCLLNFNTTQYDFTQDLQLATKNGGTDEILANINKNLLNNASPQYINVPIIKDLAGIKGGLLEANGALVLKSASATVTQGDSSVVLSISYRVIDFS